MLVLTLSQDQDPRVICYKARDSRPTLSQR